MSGLRVSAISFLNTAPLMWDFEHGDAGRDFSIEYTVPSACAAALAANQADIGIIPAFTYAQIPGLVVIPDISIASKDRFSSILLVSGKKIDDIRTVATDTSSRTSVALLQVLFTNFLGGARLLQPHPPDLQEMLRNHDAALLIGDAALQVPADAGYRTYDLAHLWHEATGKAFVFAFWAVRDDALARAGSGFNLTRVFQRSRDHGLEPGNVQTISQEWSQRLSVPASLIQEYLTQNIYYYLDEEACDGFRLFLELARAIGLLSNVPELRFLPKP